MWAKTELCLAAFFYKAQDSSRVKNDLPWLRGCIKTDPRSRHQAYPAQTKNIIRFSPRAENLRSQRQDTADFKYQKGGKPSDTSALLRQARQESTWKN